MELVLRRVAWRSLTLTKAWQGAGKTEAQPKQWVQARNSVGRRGGGVAGTAWEGEGGVGGGQHRMVRGVGRGQWLT